MDQKIRNLWEHSKHYAMRANISFMSSYGRKLLTASHGYILFVYFTAVD